MKAKTIVLIRHGETEWNAERRWQGHINIPLNENGREQASNVGRELSDFSLQRLFSSDLLRARQTAELIASSLAIPIELARELREVHVGQAEGLNREEMIRKFGDISLTSWGSIERKDLEFAFPDGETKEDALRRAKTYLEDVILPSSEQRIGIVSHGMLLRTLLHDLFPWLEEPIKMMNCDYIVLGFDSESNEWSAPEELEIASQLAASK